MSIVSRINLSKITFAGFLLLTGFSNQSQATEYLYYPELVCRISRGNFVTEPLVVYNGQVAENSAAGAGAIIFQRQFFNLPTWFRVLGTSDPYCVVLTMEADHPNNAFQRVCLPLNFVSPEPTNEGDSLARLHSYGFGAPYIGLDYQLQSDTLIRLGASCWVRHKKEFLRF